MNKSIWTARCKSEYKINGKTCNKATRRGMLMCNDCLDAIHCYNVNPRHWLIQFVISLWS